MNPIAQSPVCRQPTVTLQRLQPHQWDEVAKLAHASLDTWHRAKLNTNRFGDDWLPYRIFPTIYEALDPGCCVVAVGEDGKLAGSAFYHPRETHVGVGVVTTHPTYFGKGVARAMMEEIVRMAAGKPLRLVSSAMNLDSFSLYTKLGFVPRVTLQGVELNVPKDGLPGSLAKIRAATAADVSAIADFEFRLNGIRREHDYRFFAANAGDFWRMAVLEDDHGQMRGFLAASVHPAQRELGPGVFADEAAGAALVHWMLDRHFRGELAFWMIPVNCPVLVKQAYGWKARNRELSLASVLGEAPPMKGIILPTFMPESG